MSTVEAVATASPASPAQTAGREMAPIYLAETSFDLRDQREAIRRDLLQQADAVTVLELQEPVEVPVQVVGEVAHLLPQLVLRVVA